MFERERVREDGKIVILSAGKSASCDKNEEWACVYDLVGVGCVMQRGRLHPLENHELVLGDPDASFRITKSQFKQQQPGTLLVSDL